MTEREKVSWAGGSGTQYTFYIFPINFQFKPEDGNYIFMALPELKMDVRVVREFLSKVLEKASQK